jgi:aminoglycoside/choline kinase family phosphotransferase
MARAAGLNIPPDFADFYRDFEWMGLQRHLKVLGIFARLYHRDGKANYLNDIPLVLKYTRSVASRYSCFKPLLRILDQAQRQSS